MTLDELKALKVDEMSEGEVRELAKYLQRYVEAWRVYAFKHPSGPWGMDYVIEWCAGQVG